VNRILKESLNVRQLEKIVGEMNGNVSRETKKPEKKKDVFLKEQESMLRERFGTTVTIKQSKKKGKIELEFFSKEDLDRILDLLQEK
jgi:ParB family transcriptional regulator, chromosome partitioning protein